MSKHVKGDLSETKPPSAGGCEADGLESFVHTCSIRVEYYRSFEYCLKWETPMNHRRSSRLAKASKKSPQRSPSPNEGVIKRRLMGKRLRKPKVSTDEGRNRDIIDIINSTHVAVKDEVKFVEVADKGVDESDDDRASVASSIASGPSDQYNDTAKKPRCSQGLCLACWTLHQKAKKMKAPIKSKLSDNDPKSLTCDQWVLNKRRRPRRLPNVKGKLLILEQLVNKRLNIKTGTKQRVGEGDSLACSRPHAFLQRNLRRRFRVQVKKERKKNRRKRTRDDSLSPRAAKQQRLHSNNPLQYVSIGCTENKSLHTASGHSSSPDLVGSGNQEIDSPEDEDLTIELVPSTVTLETTKPIEAPPKQKTPRKRARFRDLLAQLRGNSSVIVMETH